MNDVAPATGNEAVTQELGPRPWVGVLAREGLHTIQDPEGIPTDQDIEAKSRLDVLRELLRSGRDMHLCGRFSQVDADPILFSEEMVQNYRLERPINPPLYMEELPQAPLKEGPNTTHVGLTSAEPDADLFDLRDEICFPAAAAAEILTSLKDDESSEDLTQFNDTWSQNLPVMDTFHQEHGLTWLPMPDNIRQQYPVLQTFEWLAVAPNVPFVSDCNWSLVTSRGKTLAVANNCDCGDPSRAETNSALGSCCFCSFFEGRMRRHASSSCDKSASFRKSVYALLPRKEAISKAAEQGRPDGQVRRHHSSPRHLWEPTKASTSLEYEVSMLTLSQQK
ncbi:uncharacterized protein Z520_01982 [Fonsecaea multimorphosa CBS 102226]|uniref:Uncharacterized protein n=1 Tax=Fonsecaea multimorphosa CBS 102226 TaxID=1442371 RepID=A0A0D2KYC9_9EURO|nr:uncharacterized protein Z520_01982 [Fonsecaea multimorphosa CBS 102226]KIY01844.1 hypothetical protein Z520_01982 [Fonsecaea multimorphosa CBS 102226]OAL29739.1 hypothetical protein AYO22_01943 [Fonsecaea multimorphosa]